MTEPDSQIRMDLNADFGEGSTQDDLAIDDAVSEFVTSVNIACGGHAGDEISMLHAVRTALGSGISIGAHPSYPDRENFGRSRMELDEASLRSTIGEQIAVLDSIARREGASIVHCKPHGALYHAASVDESVALAILQACTDISPTLRLVGQAGSRAVAMWRTWGARVIEEAFADRVYNSDGSLRRRDLPKSLITDPGTAAEQATMIASTRRVRCLDGTLLPLAAETLCIHTDTPNVPDIAARVAQALLAAGVTLEPPV